MNAEVIENPFIITSHLCWGVKIGSATITLTKTEPAEEGRTRCTFVIEDGDWSYTDSEMKTGAGRWSPGSAIETFLSFLEAAAEAYRYGPASDNYDMFPEPVMQWAYGNGDEIGMVRAWCETYLEQERAS